MKNIRFRKIKYSDKDGKVTLEYDKRNTKVKKREVWDEHTMTCHEMPVPSFLRAMAGLVPHAVNICELPEEWAEDGLLKVSSISISYSDNGTMGATITSQRKLSNSHAPLVLNTPHKPFEVADEADDSNVLSFSTVKAIDKLMEEALEYLNGERSQIEFELESTKEKEDRTLIKFEEHAASR